MICLIPPGRLHVCTGCMLLWFILLSGRTLRTQSWTLNNNLKRCFFGFMRAMVCRSHYTLKTWFIFQKKAKQHCFHLMIWSRQVDCPLVSTDSHTSGAGYSLLNPTVSVMFEIFLCLLESSAPSRKMFFLCFLLWTFFPLSLQLS